MSETIDQFSVRDLFEARDHYLIPMYQRNYAWEEGEITQLIQDVLDKVPREPGQAPGNYYIGTLVVFQRDHRGAAVFETIDGQQRLTTLSLLVAYLKNRGTAEVVAALERIKGVRLEFDCRENSRKTIEAIFKGAYESDPDGRLNEKETNAGILNGYRIIGKVLPVTLKEAGIREEEFAAYLLNWVQLMRVPVPRDTDLNHYFEVMNSRGEQLEKHEILKSRLLEVFNSIPDEKERNRCRDCLHRVWEACSNMERYVQMGFEPEQRHRLFGTKDWGQLIPKGFDDLALLCAEPGRTGQPVNATEDLDQIIAGNHAVPDSARQDEESERFNSIINFPNFLLQVLRVERKDAGRDEIPLDDKRLLDTFDRMALRAKDRVDCAKRFTFSLLKCKFLLDQFVIKREFIKGSDGWSLKRMRWAEGATRGSSGRAYYSNTFGDEGDGSLINRRILMLLSAFHVSTPTMVYKHWLNAALMHLYHAGTVEASSYLAYLESVARAFVFDRFLRCSGGLDYHEMIFGNHGRCRSRSGDLSNDDLDLKLSFGNIENNFVFNFLDYLLWLGEIDSKARAYEFTFRSSVEHYYPQNPKPGFDRLPEDALNSFGNLCLISHSKNSTLSNFMPAAKKEYYEKNPIDSIKQHQMMQLDHWGLTQIREHDRKMREVLVASLEPAQPETE